MEELNKLDKEDPIHNEWVDYFPPYIEREKIGVNTFISSNGCKNLKKMKEIYQIYHKDHQTQKYFTHQIEVIWKYFLLKWYQSYEENKNKNNENEEKNEENPLYTLLDFMFEKDKKDKQLCPFRPSEYGVSISDEEEKRLRKRGEETKEEYKKRSFCFEMLIYNEQKHLSEMISLYHLFVTGKCI